MMRMKIRIKNMLMVDDYHYDMRIRIRIRYLLMVDDYDGYDNDDEGKVLFLFPHELPCRFCQLWICSDEEPAFVDHTKLPVGDKPTCIHLIHPRQPT